MRRKKAKRVAWAEPGLLHLAAHWRRQERMINVCSATTWWRIARHGQNIPKQSAETNRTPDAGTKSRCLTENLLRCLQKKRPTLCRLSRASVLVCGSGVGLLGSGPPRAPRFQCCVWAEGGFLVLQNKRPLLFSPAFISVRPWNRPAARPSFQTNIEIGGRRGAVLFRKTSAKLSGVYFANTGPP